MIIGQPCAHGMGEFTPTDYSKVKRIPARASYDEKTVHDIIDSTLYCNVGFVQSGRPFVIPCTHGRDENTIFLHGSAVSRMLKEAGSGREMCLSFTNVDAIVLSRSQFHTSLNYRSVTVFGKGRIVDDEVEKGHAFQTIFENICPGRWDSARRANKKEMALTTVVAIEIDTAVAKIRDEGSSDEEEDLAGRWWAGILPIETKILSAQPSPDLSDDIPTPAHVTDIVGRVL